MTRVVFTVSLALALTGCPRRLNDPYEGPKALRSVQLTLQHQESADRWGVVIEFATPTAKAAFQWPGTLGRDRWRIVSPLGARMIHEGDYDVVVAADGESFDKLVLDVPSEGVTSDEGGYPVVIPFSDGGTLLFTGAFPAFPCGFDGCEGTVEVANRLPIPVLIQFLPRNGEKAVVAGQIFSESGWWRSSLRGTYVYFGKTKPVVREGFIGVVDSGLPQWLRARAEAVLPPLFELYRRRLGRSLGDTPVVFLSYVAAGERDAIEMKGATLPSVLELQVGLGEAHRKENDPEVVHRLFHFAAHQAAHLWNGELYTHAEPQGEWMHEGSVDALSLRALRQLRLIDDADVAEEHALAVSECIALREGGAPPDERAEACGATLALFTEAAVRAKQPGADLFDFWKAVFDQAPKHLYSSEAYRAVLAKLGSPDAAERVKTLTADALPNATDAIVQALRSVAVNVQPGASPPEPFRRFIAERAVARLLAASCPEGDTCPPPPPVADVLTVENLPLIAGTEAYAAANARCHTGEPVRLTVRGLPDPIALPCRRELPPPPTWFTVDYKLRVQ